MRPEKHIAEPVNKFSLSCTRPDSQNGRLLGRLGAWTAGDRYVGVLAKGFCPEGQIPGFVKAIDTLMDKGEVLKKDATSYVSRISFNGHDTVVKRYNHKGFIHSLRHTVKGCRARRCWHCANRLAELRIATAESFGYFEHRKMNLVWESYLIVEYICGRTLSDLLNDSTTDNAHKAVIMKNVRHLIDELGKHRITHGDLKHTNILITNTGIILADLDGMRTNKCNWIHNIRLNRDLARFARK